MVLKKVCLLQCVILVRSPRIIAGHETWVFGNFMPNWKTKPTKIIKARPYQGGVKKRSKTCFTPNGLICSSVRLSIVLRFLAGKRALDIDLARGISRTEAFHRVRLIVGAIHRCPRLSIDFLSSHKNNKKITRKFKEIAWMDCWHGFASQIATMWSLQRQE